jgi:hypothetical protein
LVIGGLDVGVGTNDSTYSSVQVVGEGLFFGGGFGVEIYEDGVGVRGLDLVEEGVGGAERVIIFSDEDPSDEVDDRKGFSVFGEESDSLARGVGREVGGAENALGFVEVFTDFGAMEGVVPEGEHVYAGGQEVFGDIGGDSEAGGGVFGVSEDEIGVIEFA